MSFPGVDLDLLGGCPAVTWDQPEDLNPAETRYQLLGKWKDMVPSDPISKEDPKEPDINSSDQ